MQGPGWTMCGSCSKTVNSLKCFSRAFLKAGEGETSQEMYHLMHKYLVNGEVPAWCHRGYIISPQAPIGLGLYTPGRQFISLGDGF